MIHSLSEEHLLAGGNVQKLSQIAVDEQKIALHLGCHFAEVHHKILGLLEQQLDLGQFVLLEFFGVVKFGRAEFEFANVSLYKSYVDMNNIIKENLSREWTQCVHDRLEIMVHAAGLLSNVPETTILHEGADDIAAAETAISDGEAEMY